MVWTSQKMSQFCYSEIPPRMRRSFTAQLGWMPFSTIVICLGKFPGFPFVKRMLSTRFLIPAVSMVGQMQDLSLSPHHALWHLPSFSSKGHSTKQRHVPLCPLYALHTFIKYTNYKASEWLFWLTEEAKTGTGFRQPFGDNFLSTAPPKFPLQITSHFQVLFCATASEDIYQNSFHCYCLKNHIFSEKRHLCICVSKVTRFGIMLISSGNIFGSAINPWRLL